MSEPKTTTKYLVSKVFHGTPIHEVKVLRETKSSFWTLEGDGSTRMRKKDTAIRTIHETRDAAKADLIDRETRRVERCTKELESARRALQRAIDC